jgi:Heparinase II/III-like protein
MTFRRSLQKFGGATVLALLTAASVATPAQAQTVVSGHPRLYVRPADLTALRTRVTQAPISTYYNQMRSRMDGASARHSNNEVAAFELESLALLHLIAGGTSYRDKILNTWRFQSYSAGQVDHWSLPYQVMAHSLALDYLWNDLTAAQRTSLGNVIVAMTDDLYNYSPHNVSYANAMSDYSNQLYYHLGALAFAGVVLGNEGINDGRAQFYVSEADTLLDQHMLPATNQEAGGDAELSLQSGFAGNGGWGEDMGHIDMTLPLFGRMVEAWRTGVGVNLFARSNGLAKFAKYIVYMRRPNGRMTPKANGAYGAGLSDKNIGTLGCLVSARYNDALGKHLKDVTYTSGTTYGFHQLGAVLWCNASLPAPNFATLPKTMHFQGQGEVVMRSGFGTQDTWVYLRSGPIYNGHQHDDQGNLLVDAHGGELLIENAGIEVNQETVHHNSIRVAGTDQIAYGNNAVQHASPIENTSYARGRITSVQTAAQYSYVAADMSNGYPDAVVAAPKAGKVTREVVTILPDIIIVRDRVTGSGTHQVLFHTWQGAGSLNAGAKELTVTRDAGRAWLKTMFPSTASAQVTAQGPTDLLTVSAAGSSGATTNFLHVIYVSPASTGFTPGGVTPIDTATLMGVSLVDRNGQQWSITFQKSGVGLGSVGPGSGGPAPPSAPTGVRILSS